LTLGGQLLSGLELADDLLWFLAGSFYGGVPGRMRTLIHRGPIIRGHVSSAAAASGSWPPRTGSAFAAPTAGWLVTVQADQPLWRINGVCPAPSGVRSTCNSSSRRWISTTSGSTYATSPGCSRRPSPALPGLSAVWGWGD